MNCSYWESTKLVYDDGFELLVTLDRPTYQKLAEGGKFYNYNKEVFKHKCRERSGSVLECLTWDQGAAGSSLTGVIALLCLSKTHLP